MPDLVLKSSPTLSNSDFHKEVLEDYWFCCISREASLLARKEVLTGKAKFGITGDGKELPQVAMARAFKKGDWRSGYYRDQTFMMAIGLCTLQQYFAQLYADAANDPFSGGRQMNNHYSTPSIDPTTGEWTNHKDQYNTSAGISCTAGQMARALGLALASKKYRAIPNLHHTNFSDKGNEVTFCTIGDASTSEGVFWETMNAATVMKVPLAVSVWDDGYGISVPKEFQTTKSSISTALSGFELDDSGEGIYIRKVNGHDYMALRQTYEEVIENVRTNHIPALIHVEELTQPQGHSTSGSHERYKDEARLDWELEFDCLKKFEEWIIDQNIATQTELKETRKKARLAARDARNAAWKAFNHPIKVQIEELNVIYNSLLQNSQQAYRIAELHKDLNNTINPVLAELVGNARQVYFLVLGEQHAAIQDLKKWLENINDYAQDAYHSHLYSQTEKSALRVPAVEVTYAINAPMLNGYQIINNYFEKAFQNDPRLFAFGEDVGMIGDVNQGFAGLQKKFGIDRIFDTGIREWTIMGQAIGMAMRGLRPIAEIQYLDYLIYGLEPLCDDLATLRYRSDGQQKAPAIIRTRGHRLEGIWHAGSPIGMILNSLRGMYVCVPRNMTQAVGMYNTLLQSDDPALVIECLNGYRLKEKLPSNLGDFSVPLGVPDTLQYGSDVTLITYGSCVRVAQDGIKLLEQHGISVELIDVQTLLPFDLEHHIVESISRTNRVVFMDEDVPGGASAYMMQEVLEKQGAYQYLDSAPLTLTAKAHRPAYGSDGDYFSKPNPEDVFETIYKMIYETEPHRFAGPL